MGLVNLNSLKNEIKKMEEKKETLPAPSVTTETTLFQTSDFPEFPNLTEDGNINIFLKNKYIEWRNLGASTTLSLGKLYEEVAEKVKELDGEIPYCKFLDLIGTNRMTALRYRRRYKLYTKVKEEQKKFVLCLRDDLIAKISSYSDFDFIIEFINEGTSKEELQKLIEEDSDEVQKTKEEIIVLEDFDIFNNNFFASFHEKIEVLSLEKKREIKKYYKKIEKILENS